MLASPGDVAFTLFGFPVYYYGIIMALAVFAGFCVTDYLYKNMYNTPSPLEGENSIIKMIPSPLLQHFSIGEGAFVGEELSRTNAGEVRGEGLNNLILDISPWLIIIGIIGARLYYCLVNYSYYIHKPLEIFFIRQGGLSIHGMIIAGALALFYFSKKYKVPFLRLTDCFLCGTILAQSIGRWGNFFNSEAFGYPCDLPWKLYIPISHRPLEYINYEYFHPTFLYESLLDLGIFIVMFLTIKYLKGWMSGGMDVWQFNNSGLGENPKEQQFDNSHTSIPLYLHTSNASGIITSLYLILYALVRIFVEQFRIDSALNIFGIPIAQIVSVAMLCFGVALLKFTKQDNRP